MEEYTDILVDEGHYMNIYKLELINNYYRLRCITDENVEMYEKEGRGWDEMD